MKKIVGRGAEKSQYILTPITASSYNKGISLNGGFSAIKNITNKTVVILLAFFVAFAGLFITSVQTSPPAKANIINDAFCNNSYNDSDLSKYGKGTTGVEPDLSLAQIGASAATSIGGVLYKPETYTTKLTAWEKYGTSGTNFTSWKSLMSSNDKADDAVTFSNWKGEEVSTETNIPTNSPYWSTTLFDCTGFGSIGWVGMSNFILTYTELGVTFINLVYTVAFWGSEIFFKGIYVIINDIVTSMKDILFIPFLQIFIVLGAVWMFWQGVIKRKSTEALQGAVWMIGASIAGGILLSNPSYIPTATGYIVNTVTSVTNNTITQGAATSAASNNQLCNVNTDLILSDTADKENSIGVSTATTNARVTTCTIWYSLVYVPWVVGQFGVTPNDANAGEILKVTPGLTSDILAGIPVTFGNYELTDSEKDLAIIQLNSQVYNNDLLKSTSDTRQPVDSIYSYEHAVQSAVAYNQLVEQSNVLWTGKLGMNMFSVASTSLIAMLSVGLIVMLFGIEMIMLKFALAFLVLLMPIFLLVGAHPGMGRRIAMRWLEFVTNVTIKQILLGFILSVMILLYTLAFASLWFFQIIMVIALTVLGLSYKSKIMNIFAEVDFGGEKKLTDPGQDASSGIKRTLSAVAGAAAGAAAAGLAVSTGGASLAAGAAGAGAAGASAAGAGATAAGGAPAVAPALAQGGKAIATPEAQQPTPKNKAAENIPANNEQKVIPEVKIKDDRDSEVRKAAIMKGAIMGAMNGFSSGNLQGAVFGASSTGMMIGDQISDNARQNDQNRSLMQSSQLQSTVSEQMLEELREMRRIQTNSQGQPSVQEWLKNNRQG